MGKFPSCDLLAYIIMCGCVEIHGTTSNLEKKKKQKQKKPLFLTFESREKKFLTLCQLQQRLAEWDHKTLNFIKI